MPSPFPGVDPYLERQGFWPGVHNALIVRFSDALNEILPGHYAALVEERLVLLEEGDEPSGQFRPDVAIAAGPVGRAGDRGGAVATLEPVTHQLARIGPDRVREAVLRLVHLPDRTLVTAIALLSPANKVGSGRAESLDKRLAMIDQPVHLVEIDLLLGGHRLPMRPALPSADFSAIISRAERRPDAEVYSWSIRDALPTIPIPLRPPDPDVPLDLASAFSRAYDHGRFARLIDYNAPLDLPLAPDDRAWAEQQATAGRRP